MALFALAGFTTTQWILAGKQHHVAAFTHNKGNSHNMKVKSRKMGLDSHYTHQ